jgi:hypothetical protein
VYAVLHISYSVQMTPISRWKGDIGEEEEKEAEKG